MSIFRSPHVLGLSSLENVFWGGSECCFPPAAKSIPTNSHISWSHLHFLKLSLLRRYKKTSRAAINYSIIFSDVRPYINTSSKIISCETFFRSRSFASLSYSFCSFIAIIEKLDYSFNAPMIITFRHIFPYWVNSSSIYCSSTSGTNFQYPLSISTAIKFFESVPMSLIT